MKANCLKHVNHNYYISKFIMTSLSLIVAIDKNGGISKNGVIPWKIKEDTIFFVDVTKREYTKGLKNVLIMGKNTWLACRDTLKNRIIVVVSLSTTSCDEYVDTIVVKTFKAAVDASLALVENHEAGHIFICGGANIYKEACNSYNIDAVYLTEIDRDYECDNHINSLVEFFKMDYFTFSTHTFNVEVLNSQNTTVKITFKKLYSSCLPPNVWIQREETQYLDLLEDVLNNGHFRQTRNSNTWSLFSKHLEFDLSKGFPLFTTRRSFFKGIVEELCFFLRGQTDSKILEEKGINIWKGNSSREFLDSVNLTYPEGTIGNLYGYQWSHFGYPYQGPDFDYTGKGFNQLEACINLLKTDPHSRRIMMTAFDPSTADQGVLRPCHSLFIQFYVEKGHRLSMTCYNRAQDLFLGTNFNVPSSSLLIYLFCEVINNDVNYTGPKFTPGRLIMNLGDCHIYEDHREMAIRQILRDPYPFPKLKINRKVTELTDFQFEDFELVNYECYPNIIAKMIA